MKKFDKYYTTFYAAKRALLRVAGKVTSADLYSQRSAGSDFDEWSYTTSSHRGFIREVTPRKWRVYLSAK